MKSWIAFWALMFAGLGSLLFWKNTRTYCRESVRWRLVKSAADMVLIVVSAARIPALLIGWCVLWITRPIKNPVLRTSMAIIAGLSFSLIGAKAIELLILSSVFAIDLVTGRNGFLKNWQKAAPEEKLISAA